MFSINTNVPALFIASNFVWFFFTAYVILNQIKREKKAQRMINRLSESNVYLNDELSDLRKDYIKLKRSYDEMQIAIQMAVNSVTDGMEEMKDEVH